MASNAMEIENQVAAVEAPFQIHEVSKYCINNFHSLRFFGGSLWDLGITSISNVCLELHFSRT